MGEMPSVSVKLGYSGRLKGNRMLFNDQECFFQDEVKSLRKEVAQLKTLLIAHKDCPVTMQQRSRGQITADICEYPC